MSQEGTADYYEVLQVSASAELETIDRVFRILAQRYHPDNQETGDEGRFRELLAAYTVLRDPESRAGYDVAREQRRQDRMRLASAAAPAENDFETEQAARLHVLEALYTKRRLDPDDPGIYSTDLEELTGRPREHLAFTVWFLVQKKFLTRDDQSRLLLTAEGAEYLEHNYRAARPQQRRLRAAGDGK